MSMRITVEAELNPTEDEAKVRRAVLNIFPAAKPEKVTKPDGFELVRVNGSSVGFLETFRRLIKQDKIRDAARKVIRSRVEGERITIYLHKQAAFAGHVSFCAPEGESPQGPIAIRIDTPTPDSVVDYLTAKYG
jgi:hypothetical protein